MAGLWLILLAAIICVGVVVGMVKEVLRSRAVMFDDYAIVVFNPKTHQTSVVYKYPDKVLVQEVPGDTPILVTRGFGNYRLDKIYSLGQLSGIGERLLMESIANNYQLPVLGIVLTSEVLTMPDMPVKQHIIRAIKEGRWTGYSKDSHQTRLAILLQFWRTKEELFSRVQSLVSKTNLTHAGIINEDLAIEVINTTQINGLAENFASYLEANNLRVVRVDSRDRPYGFICRVQTRANRSDSYTSLWIAYFRNCEIGEASGEPYRTDITVEVGAGYRELLEGK